MESRLSSVYIRILIYIILLLISSSILGPWIVSSELLYSYYFYIYANLGKLIIYSAAIFYILTKNEIKKIILSNNIIISLIYLFIGISLIPIFFLIAKDVLLRNQNLLSIPSVLIHLIFLSIQIFIVLAVFGVVGIKNIFKLFYKKIILGITVGVILDVLIFKIWNLWPYLSSGVINIVSKVYLLSGNEVLIVPPHGLYVNKFGIQIDQACSGLDSIFLFISLYGFIILIEWRRINKFRALFLFIINILGMYLLNIFRVSLLILIGLKISPEISLTLFHTYAGMVLFIIYFYIFWRFTNKWLSTSSKKT